MTNGQIILSYHKFVETESNYRFSRTYDQFWHDIRKKEYTLITIDDGMKCQIKACEMLTELGIQAMLFTCTSLVGEEGYCTWDELKELSKYHLIENHAHFHKDHSTVNATVQFQSIKTAQKLIKKHIGREPKYFVAPYNRYNEETNEIVRHLKLKSLKNRIDVLNISK